MRRALRNAAISFVMALFMVILMLVSPLPFIISLPWWVAPAILIVAAVAGFVVTWLRHRGADSVEAELQAMIAQARRRNPPG